MAKFTITRTTKGWFRVETRFQRVGTYKTERAAQDAVEKEERRLAFFAQAASSAPQTYEGIMAANAEARRQWEG
jgi:hypothetical protein|tara:strand:- start:632 stop:853 length:222 start_codon:yes stop_codon:yes gene_type:complete